MKRKTKIVCTLGPSTDSVTEIERLLEAGMNVARLNFSHGSYEYMEKILKNLKEACLKTGKSVAILQDLQGPKIRLGKLPEKGIPVKRGEIIILSTDGKSFNPLAGKMIPVQYRSLHKDVKSKDLILIDDGYIEVQVQKIVERKIYCKVKTSGVLKSHKGVNCPTASIKAASITAKDLADLKFGLKNEIDYVALSFVRKAEDIENLRKKLIENNHQHVQIIAKIERHEAVKNLKEIAKASDGLMVARGDLGIEIPAEQVPIVQKEIVRIGRILGKPVIIATQISKATRAEISDAATAIFEHADAFMLSGETSTGRYPFKAAQTLAKVAHAVEKEIQNRIYLTPNYLFNSSLSTQDAICYNAVILADKIKARFIVILTKTGYPVCQITKYRPHTPIVVITPHELVKRQLHLVWGIEDVLISGEKISSEDEAARLISSLLKKKKLAKTDQKIVIVNIGQRHNFITTVKI